MRGADAVQVHCEGEREEAEQLQRRRMNLPRSPARPPASLAPSQSETSTGLPAAAGVGLTGAALPARLRIKAVQLEAISRLDR